MRGIRGLEAAGCGAIAIPCNTAHYFYEGLARELPVPVLNMVALTVDKVMASGCEKVGILATEGGKTGQALSNTNGTWDLGAFQVNTCHVKELLRAGFSPDMVLRDGCTNAYAAAWVLRKEYDRTRNIWDAVGAYHSRTPHLRDAYLGRVKKHLAKLERVGLESLLLRTGGTQ